MLETTSVLFFLNGLGALTLSRCRSFAGFEMPFSLRMQLGMFGAVFFLLGFFLSPTVLW